MNVSASDSAYFTSEKEEKSMDNIFNQLLPEYDNYRIYFVSDSKKNPTKRGDWRAASVRRQGGVTAGLFQLPSRLPDSLLNSCRPGARNGNNYKCTNPLM